MTEGCEITTGSVVPAVDAADAYCGAGAGAGAGAAACVGAVTPARGWVSMAVMTASETPCCRKKTIWAAVKLKEVPELFM